MRKLLAGCVCSLLFACAAVAGDGHDHGEEKAAATPAAPAAPRLVMGNVVIVCSSKSETATSDLAAEFE